jgi:trehalose synthase
MMVGARPIERLAQFNRSAVRQVAERLDRVGTRLGGNVVHHLTASADDGVAGILRSVLGYARYAGFDSRWTLVEPDSGMTVLRRRLYNGLYGDPGDGGPLGPAEARLLIEAGERAADALDELIGAGDVVLLHDSSLAGLVTPLRARGSRVIWRSHLGVEEPDGPASRARLFLLPLIQDADAFGYSSERLVWPEHPPERTLVVRPAIDPLSPKNEELDDPTVEAVLDVLGLTDAPGRTPPTFARFDGSPARFDRPGLIDQSMPLPVDAPVVAQISGWEQLKDQAGLLTAFARNVPDAAHLIIAGPSTVDLPEGSEETHVVTELQRLRTSLAPETAARIHLVQLPTADVDENEIAVNAIQRRATVVVHKSFAEAFGLSVTEAMWKRRPVIASRVGGMQDQVIDGETGILVDDPGDLDAFGSAIGRVLADPGFRHDAGEAARARVAELYLPPNHLAAHLDAVELACERSP